MSAQPQVIALRTSPHLKGVVTTDTIMLNVVYALLPVAGFAVFAFGLSALLLMAVCTGVCVLTEHLICRIQKKESTVGDYSAIITGLLLAMTLPPAFPLWMGATGAFISMALGKMLFGGLGQNPVNPALVGRAFLQAAFPVAITTWSPAFYPEWMSIDRFMAVPASTLAIPFMSADSIAGIYAGLAADGWSGATALSKLKFDGVSTGPVSLFTGFAAGSTGETSSLIILLCGLYLIARKMMDWRIPLSMLGSAALLSGVLYAMDADKYPSPLFTLFSGGLMLGAFFMASDMVGSPTTRPGVWIYGVLIGSLVVVIRVWGGLPEGVMYAILLGNASSPVLNQITQPKSFGRRTAERLKKAATQAEKEKAS